MKKQHYDYSATFNYVSLDPENLDNAVERGFDWIYTGWLGKDCNDKAGLPVYMADDRKLTALRKPNYPKIAKQIDKLAGYHKAAKERGLKVGLFMYEPSVPAEMKEAYPEVFYPYPQEYLDRMPEHADARFMCIYDSRVQEWVSAKVAETIKNVWPIDAYIFTCSETMWGSGPINHICANCYDKPRWEALKHLYEAIKEGVRRSGKDVQVIQRGWSLHHPDVTRQSVKHMLESTPHDNELQAAIADTLQAGERPYVASRDYPLFMDYLEKQPNPCIISKATCTDFLMHQPVNPWVGHSGDKVEEILELSLEPCFQELYGFIPCIYLRQIQQHLQYGLDRGAKGVALCPIEANVDWELNTANLDVGKQLIDDPYAKVEELLGDWTEKRYGQRLEDWLIAGILDSEDILADLASYNGMSHLINFDCFRQAMIWLINASKYHLRMITEAFPDSEERLSMTREGLAKAIATWNRRVRQAKALNERVKAKIDTIPESARREVSHFFERLEVISLYSSLCAKQLFTRLALESGQIKPDMTLMRLMERWDCQIHYLIASDKDIQEKAFFLGPMSFDKLAWQYPDIGERDAFPGIGEDTETIVGEVTATWESGKQAFKN